MKAEIEPMQQPVRKVVGRFPKGSNPLVRLAQLNAFIHKIAKHELPAGELFPVRKSVGRPRSRKDQFDVQAMREIIARESRSEPGRGE